MSTICVDAGFLIALYDERDQYHAGANDRFVQYFDRTRNQLLAPWPILYETVSTRLVRNRQRMERFRRDWLAFKREDRLRLLDDGPIRLGALDECLAEVNRSGERYRSLSLVDRVIRLLLADTSLRIDYFITFNPADFADIGRKYRRTIA